MVRRSLLAGALVLFFCSILMARQGIVRTDDGRSIAGDISDDPNSDTVTIRVGSAQIAVDRSDVLSIDYGDDVVRQFNQSLSQLPATDVRGRLQLGRWALDNNQYELARRAANDALRVDPGNADAITLLQTIAAQESLSAKRTEAAPIAPAAAPSDTAAAAPVVQTQPSGEFLTDDEVNNIRQSELRPDDDVRVQYERGIREAYLKQTGEDPQSFANLSPTAQALRIIGMGDPRLSAGVRIMTDPASLSEFHRRIMPKILVGCASSGCHGDSATAGEFYLFRDATETRQWYTNFYILQQYRLKLDSAPTVWGKGPLERRMVDRSHAAQSLLIQFGLPRAVADLPHPPMNGWSPIFTGDQDPYFAEMMNWIGHSLVPLDPEYNFNFPSPSGAPSAQPGSAP
jgi:hypothetical protein